MRGFPVVNVIRAASVAGSGLVSSVKSAPSAADPCGDVHAGGGGTAGARRTGFFFLAVVAFFRDAGLPCCVADWTDGKSRSFTSFRTTDGLC